MNAMPYSQWKDTAYTLHMLLQMMGKVKLCRMPPQPEWNHALLQITTTGFTTGLIPGVSGSFEVRCDLHASRMSATCTSGREAGFSIWGQGAVSGYYHDFLKMLAFIGQSVEISVLPQEVADATPFDRQCAARPFDIAAARNYFDMAVFAHNVLLRFASPMRGKKIQPQLFWGTFDMTTVLFSGAEKPFAGDGLVERAAFDEQFIEFGYWPGGPAMDDPSFFAMAYPFLQEAPQNGAVSPAEAFFNGDKKEYMLRLSDVLKHDRPQAAVEAFCASAFDVIAKAQG